MKWEKPEGKELYVASVDDDAGLQDLYETIFSRKNIGLYKIKHPEYCLADLENEINLIISDGDGIIQDVVNHRDLFFENVPILLCTGNPNIIDNYKASHGIPGVAKPFSPSTLVDAVRQYANPELYGRNENITLGP